MATPKARSAGDGGGSTGDLDRAISASDAFNTSWRQALAEITSALQQAQSQVLELEGKSTEIRSALADIGNARDAALAAIRAARGAGDWDNIYDDPRRCGYGAQRDR